MIKEKHRFDSELEDSDEELVEKPDKEEEESLWNWFKQWNFYQYGLVYVGARILNNISASMLQFYLIYILDVNKGYGEEANSIYLAIFPLISCTASTIVSNYMGSLSKNLGRKMTFTIGLVVQIIVSVLLMV